MINEAGAVGCGVGQANGTHSNRIVRLKDGPVNDTMLASSSKYLFLYSFVCFQ